MALIRMTPDRNGGIQVEFQSKRLAKRVVKAMASQSDADRAIALHEGVYLQSDEQLEGMIPPRALAELREGYTIKVRMDGWTAAHFYGWDAHTAFEGGRS